MSLQAIDLPFSYVILHSARLPPIRSNPKHNQHHATTLRTRVSCREADEDEHRDMCIKDSTPTISPCRRRQASYVMQRSTSNKLRKLSIVYMFVYIQIRKETKKCLHSVSSISFRPNVVDVCVRWYLYVGIPWTGRVKNKVCGMMFGGNLARTT